MAKYWAYNEPGCEDPVVKSEATILREYYAKWRVETFVDPAPAGLRGRSLTLLEDIDTDGELAALCIADWATSHGARPITMEPCD